MPSDDVSYAPKSPDLSSLFSNPAPPPQSQSRAPGPAYQQAQPQAPAYLGPPHRQQQQQDQFVQSHHRQRHSYSSPSDPPAQRAPPPPPPSQSYYLPAAAAAAAAPLPGAPFPPHSNQEFQGASTYYSDPVGYNRPPPTGLPQAPPPPQQAGYGFPLPASPGHQQQQQQQQYYSPAPPHYGGGGGPQQSHPFPPQAPGYGPLQQGQFAYPLPVAAPAQAPLPPSQQAAPPPTFQEGGMPPRRSAAQPAADTKPKIVPSMVRTKFPTARIKRIMQADEEVGKVAQQTPIAVGKALELFMVQIVTKSAELAQEKNSKRVTAQILKQVVETSEQWDFLRDIVAKVDPDEKGGGKASRVKAETDSDEDVDHMKKKGKGGRKKKS